MTPIEREDLILKNSGLVRVIAKKAWYIPYIRKSLGGLDEIFQTGMVALCRAIDGFDPTKLARSGPRKGKPIAFGSYAGRAIWNEITAAALKEAVVTLPTSYRKMAMSSLLTQKVEQAIGVKQLDHLIACENICDRSQYDSLDILVNKEIRKKVLKKISRLDSRERLIIRSTFGIGTEEATLCDMSRELHLTKQRAQQIKILALEKLKQMKGWEELV